MPNCAPSQDLSIAASRVGSPCPPIRPGARSSPPRRLLRHLARRWPVLLLFVAAQAVVAGAPPSGATLVATVRDVTGAVVAGADATLVTARQTAVASARTDDDGSFTVRDLPPGRYVLVVRAPAFEEVRTAITVPDTAEHRVDITLDLRGVEEEVTVTATAGRAEAAERSPQSVNVIGQEAILERTRTIVAQAVAEEVGVHLQRTSPTIAGVFVRGLTGNKVNVFVDGVRFTTGAQRGGINTFLDLIEPTGLEAVEVLRGPNSAQYGSDALGGSVQFLSRTPSLSPDGSRRVSGLFSASGSSADESLGGNVLLAFSAPRFGGTVNLAGRRIGDVRPGGGIDSHAAVTRFLGLPSNRLMPARLPDTGFSQYGGSARMNWTPTPSSQLVVGYTRSRQDDGKRYDQLLGGDGNLVADLRGLTLDLFMARYERAGAGWFDRATVTYSLNSQREERVNQGGNGNPRNSITSEPERTTVHGVQASVAKTLWSRQTLQVGGDAYFEGVDAASTARNPVTGVIGIRRGRVPDGATYRQAGAYAQTTVEAVPDRVRLDGSVRVSTARYRARASDSPLVNGAPLWPDDRLDSTAGAFRAGALFMPHPSWSVAVNASRGYRAPHITDLGTLGLTGSGFEVAAPDVASLGAMVGTTADRTAVSTGDPVRQVGPERSLSFDAGVRYRTRRVRSDLTVFVNTIRDNIAKQALILPPGAVGTLLGGQAVTQQTADGAVFVAASTNPVLVRTNFDDARIKGVEHRLEWRASDTLAVGTVFTWIHAEDLATGRAPNIEGGTPAPDAYLTVRYIAPSTPWWVEPYLHAAARQDRLSTLDLEDRRTGATRSRTSIRNFFLNGATVRGWVSAGPDATYGTADDVLTATGETLAQIQDRVLGAGVTAAPLFTAVPGYVTVGVRAGWRLGRHEFLVDAENLGDRNYRGISWGVDAPGRSMSVRYLLRLPG